MWKILLIVLFSLVCVNCRTIETRTEENPEHARHWFNATRKPPTDFISICPQEEEFLEEEQEVKKIPYEVQVEVWCWSSTFKCMETEIHYRDEIIKKNVTKKRMVEACCDGFEINPNSEKCEPVCSQFCENNGFCVAPETCHCEFGYEGNFCQIDALPAGILVGPNVCEAEEEYMEDIVFTENEIVQWEEKHWCWSIPPRCSKTKSAQKPIQKVKHVPKTRTVVACCPGSQRNQAGNRCLPVADVEDIQQIVV